MSLVSIGVPVYNAEKFLSATLDSLLAQDYPQLEFVISDNASSDRTEEICARYARRDPRIRYSRNPENEGWVANFNRVARLANGKHFMWASAHDVWLPTYVSRCVALLERDPSVVLAYSQARYADANLQTLIDVMPDALDTRGMTREARYRYVMWNLHWCNLMQGVMRLDVLRTTSLLTTTWCGDHLFVAEMALRGAFAQADEVLFIRVRNRPPESPEDWKRRVLEYTEPRNVAPRIGVGFSTLYAELRDAHLALVRRELSGWARLHALLSTYACFSYRFGVPVARSRIMTGAIGFPLHRFRLYKLLR